MANKFPSVSTPELMDDDALLDEDGNIRSGQPESAPEKEPVLTESQRDNRLTSDNFKIVRQHAEEVRSLVTTKESLQHFSNLNQRLQEQGIRPRWMGRPLSPPFLPGSTILPEEFHAEWDSTVKKFEGKLLRKLIKQLPPIVAKLESNIAKTRKRNLAAVKQLVTESKPGQKKRSETIFYKLCTRTERVPLAGSRPRPLHRVSPGHSSTDAAPAERPT